MWVGFVGLAIVFSSGLAGAQQSASRDAPAGPGIDITLRPERDVAGNVAAVSVTFRITDTASAGPTISFRAPMSTPRAGSSRIITRGCIASHRASSTFC